MSQEKVIRSHDLCGQPDEDLAAKVARLERACRIERAMLGRLADALHAQQVVLLQLVKLAGIEIQDEEPAQAVSPIFN
jgi:hypothetical protein